MSSSNQFRLLHDFDSYSPDTLDLSLDSEAKTYWFKCFHRLVLKFEQQAAKSQNTDPTAVDRAAQFRNYYLSQLEQLQQESPSLNPKPLAIRDLLELNETSLRRFGFDDPWKEQKQLENQASIKKLSSRLQYIDQLVDTGAIWTEIIKGVLAGNMFDWGAQAVSQILENDENFGLEEALERIQKRPWLVDCLDQWLERIKGEPHKCATIFTDNSGIDIVLGILPLVRQLLLQKTKVILCANTKPALNDITYEELQQLVEQCCSKCRIIDEAYKTGMLQIFGNEQNGPCLDFRLLTEEPVTSSPEEKLYTFFNQDADKDKHNIYRAFNGHEAHNTFEGLNTSRGLDDLKAMSVASLYEGDDSVIEMNTVRPDDSKSIGSSVNLHCATEARIVPTAMPLNHTEDILHPVSAESNECPCNPYGETPSVNNSLYFADGIRSVDFVLVWKIATEEQIHLENVRQTKRFTFEQNLISDGLELEREVIENEIHFIKIHAPLEVLRRYSEILKLRMPMKEIPGMAGVRSRTTSILSRLKGFAGKLARRILVEEKYFPPRSHRFTAVYSRDKEYLFDLKQACFFTAAIRSRIVQFILDRKRFLNDSNNDYAFGIERLITDEVYIAAYPLHDGEITVPGSMRHLLYTRWAAVSKWYRYQPLDYIKEYFGVKIGLYFAWLGYYTYMLLLASIVGVICFVYSWKTLKYNTPSEEICSKENIIKMCPLCDHWCDYWELSETCLHARVTYLFDNPTTVLFAIFMSFWAALFLELWKRYSAEITHRWDLTGFDIHEEHPRPQYLARLAHVRRKKINAVTNTEEPQVPYWRMKLPATILSFSVVLLLVCLAIVAVLAVVLYRMSVLATLSVYGDEVTTSTAILFTTATAATINLCLIVVFNWMYTYLAEWLTERELLRTQTEFDDSLTLKIYLLQFVNYYASIFYIAFFKGKFIGYPGNYNRFFNFRQEECGFGGCLMELCIQLGIIMIGKQAVNTALEMAIPLFYRWLNSLKVRIGKERNQSLKSKGQRFVKDLKLVEWGSRGLFPEYLEMVLQYGFVTIFVAAFPLAPLFALLNNILEMRLDAKKLLTFYRRPVSQRVRDIGIWYRILDSIGKLSVITNGFIIAFTSDFIPKFVYRLSVSSDGSLNGYLNYTLAYFNTSDFQKGSAPFQSQYNVTICRYPDFRAPPWSNTPYEKTTMYWLIMAARLAFVVIFENIVAIVMILVRWCIPDMSQELRDQIRREAYITNEIIIKQETLRARMDREADTAPDELSAPRFRKPKESGNDSFIQLERLISSNLSGSQLDLFIHSEREDQRKTRNDKVSSKFL